MGGKTDGEPLISMPYLYDKEEIIENCTVQVLTNTVTGEQSVGWWKQEKQDPVTYRIRIGAKLPSLNEYIDICRKNPYGAADFKRQIEDRIALYLIPLPPIQKPVRIHFHWVEENKRRDLDNVAAAKKFILDAMVKKGKLKNDSHEFVVGFSDTFEYGKTSCVFLEITEVDI